MLSLTPSQIEQLITHAQTCYPEECCGLLLGQNKIVREIWPTENTWTLEFSQAMPELLPQNPQSQSRHDRFAIAPAAILKAQKYARAQDLAIIGIYHSHPDHAAIPSEYDRAIAWDIYSYLILSVHQRRVADYRSWQLDGDRQFQEEPIQIQHLDSEFLQ
ncbi:M67 family metallopeptidase [Picosynechococcus sp. PCC 11901]|uniref:Mov34/MPN/PAD-1 family protein n=1 Tax=Picosynechococcus sp. PCC 11901 TaxID=2579791 RepID=UPI0010FBC1B5|nr:M67 family metallopeptidase [Picosynechococcus sp. PCC 11901]QCS49959.1 M67 family metallopeptidase [Picosynechococcus sp. PCC 11901]